MDREILYDRVNQRVDIMLEQGLIEEVKNLISKYNELPTAIQGLVSSSISLYSIPYIKELTYNPVPPTTIGTFPFSKILSNIS